MIKKLNKNGFLLYSIIIGLIVFIITLIRAKTTSITYDEAFTYMTYVSNNPFNVFKYLIHKGSWANNHILNTLFISCLQMIFKNYKYSEILIRIPSLIFYVLYILYSYKISKKFKHKYFSYNLFVLNYGLNEFFGLARGYGIACTLVLIGLYYFSKWREGISKFKNLNLSYIFLILACYANTVALLSCAVILIYSFIILIKEKLLTNYIKKNWYLILIYIILGLLITRYHFMISDEGLPLYGSNDSFWNSVYLSMFVMYGFSINISKCIAVLCIVLFFLTIIKFKKNILRLNNVYMPIVYFIILIILTLVTKQMWITGRCLIPFIPIFIFGICELFEILNIKNFIFYIIVSAGLFYNFYNNFDLSVTREWIDNYEIKELCFEAYNKKQNTLINDYKLNEVTNFYRNKIKVYLNYDIYD